MKTRYSADDAPSIAQRLKELEVEKTARINGISIEDAKPVEAPKDLDWTSVYGYPMGYVDYQLTEKKLQDMISVAYRFGAE